jgi:DNA polymerase
MDAREKLRLYLEQRRELGESDLVLDSMSVEDVLKLVGQRSAPATATGSPPAPERNVQQRVRPAPPSDVADWRDALRATGGAPEREETPMPVKKAVPAALEPSEPAPAAIVQAPGIVVGKPPALSFDEIARMPSLDAIADAVRKCTRCPLYATAKQGVPGEGNPNARFVCVGEAPGATEDETGRPFVGAAGQLLTKILAAIDLPREDVFICNVIKHRPPGNRNPLPNEIAACSPYLVRQLELIKPGVILALGTFAAQTLLETKESIGKLRGRVHRYHGIPLVVTYHPAALLRNPSWKRPTWDDVQLARRILDSSPLAGA